MNVLFTLDNKHGINSFVYQGGKQSNALPANAKDIEDLNVLKNYISGLVLTATVGIVFYVL